MSTIDINCDMGETYKERKVGNDERVMPYISSCNIACGFHGGDPLTIEKTIKLALHHKVAVGAHPSYPDLENFGRRAMDLSNEELEALLKYQISALKGMTEALGAKLHHIKPHGALYNTAARNAEVAEIIVNTLKTVDKNLFLYGPAGNAMWKDIATNAGINYVAEFFSDRNYNDDLTLVSRDNSDALLPDADKSILHTLEMLKTNEVTTITGEKKHIKAETICIHGDKQGADVLALKLSEALISNGFKITAPE